jgi:Protein of unknown function (DUF1488)
MTLQFPNPSRNYDLTRRCVCFWGHDSAKEVSFHLDEGALYHISRFADRDEASLLHVFDVNRGRIEAAASDAYSKGRKSFYRLSASDFGATKPTGGIPWPEVTNTAIEKPRSLKS